MLTKILSSPLYVLRWINRNPAEMMLLSIFIFSFLPFFMHIGSPTMLGGLMLFFTCIAREYIFDYNKKDKAKLYSILLLILIFSGLISMWFIADKDFKGIGTPIGGLLSVFHGGFWGAMVSHFIISRIDTMREEKQRQKEIDRINFERQQEAKMIAQKEQEGYIAIKREGKLIGYIPKDKYDGFVNMNLITK